MTRNPLMHSRTTEVGAHMTNAHLPVVEGDRIATWMWIHYPIKGWPNWESHFLLNGECVWCRPADDVREDLLGVYIYEAWFPTGAKICNEMCVVRKRKEVFLGEKGINVDNIVALFEAGKLKL